MAALTVRFTKTALPYRKGDIAGFQTDIAQSLIDKGVAAPYEPEAHEGQAASDSDEDAGASAPAKEEEKPGPTAAAAPVEIPDGWQNLQATGKIAIAASISGGSPKNAAEAEKIIRAELERRAA